MKTTDRAVDVAGVSLPLTLIRHARSRHFIVRYHPVSDSVTLTLPKRAAVGDALKFLEDRRIWLAAQRRPFASQVVIADGVTLPILGQEMRIQATGSLRGVVELKEGVLHVPGAPEHLPRRVRDFIKSHLLAHLRPRIAVLAGEVGRKPGRVNVRDTQSLWGSCTAEGNLSFSWRLIFAPPEVLDYLVSHEVAHLRHMNHSASFWRLVEALCPHHRASRAWLKREGHRLYGYRF